jgi:hypothetical protein
MQGLGDAIAKITDAMGIEKCKGCEKRQEKLNKLLPFGVSLSGDEIAFLKGVYSWYNGLPIQADKVHDMKRCNEIHARIYNTKGCKTCGSYYQNKVMEDLKGLIHGI